MSKYKQKTKYLLFIALIWLPLNTSAGSYIVSTIKNPDPYSGNQSWFRYYEYPGGVIEDAVVLRNIGDSTETIKLYAADATANQAGSFSPKMEEDTQKGIGVWTTLEKKEITLGPDESTEVNFQIRIPKEISPGQYFGSIISEQISTPPCDPIQAVSDQCPAHIQIKTRVGNRIYLNIPGEIKHDIKLSSFDWKRTDKNSIHFKYTFNNNGNIAFEPKAIIHIYNIFGQKVESLEAKLGKSLPGTTISPIVSWDFEDHFGDFTVKTEIYYQEEDLGRFNNLHGAVLSERAEMKIFIFPWTLAKLALLIVILLGTSYLILKTHFKKLLSHAQNYTVKDGENLVEIAEKFGTNWRYLALINKIKPPYVLDNKQKLKIPATKKSKNEK